MKAKIEAAKDAPQSSPLPWKVQGLVISVPGKGAIVNALARTNSRFSSDVTPAEAEANAALIVRRVNEGQRMDALVNFIEKRYERVCRELSTNEMRALTELLGGAK